MNNTNRRNCPFVLDLPPPMLDATGTATHTNPRTNSSSLTNYRRSAQRHLGQHIARRRLLSQTNNHRDLYQGDGTNLLFRRSAAFEGDDCWDDYDPYCNVTFLNQHDIVVASDMYGKIDVVRLPRYQSPDGGDNDCSGFQSLRPLGSLLAGKLEMQQSSSTLVQKDHVKLKSIQGGNSFVVGMPCGEFRVFATEHASTWGEYHPRKALSRPPPTPIPSTIPNAFLLQDGVSLCDRIQNARMPSPCPLFVRNGWRIQVPRRRYERDINDTNYSLQSSILNHNQADVSQSYSSYEAAMTQVAGWNDDPTTNQNSIEEGTYQPYDTRHGNRNDVMWDFRETPSGLLAAHIDSHQDCFSLRVMDDRIVQCPLDNNRGGAKGGEGTVCIDMTSNDSGSDCIENVTSICFSSDNCLATAHEWYPERSPTSSHAPMAAIKLWDIRMIRRSCAEPVGETVISPQYPNDRVHGAKPTAVLDIPASHENPLHNDSMKGASLILGLCGAAEGIGTIIMTTCTPDLAVQHALLDTARMKVSQTIQTHQAQNSPQAFIVAVTANHDLVASYSKERDNNNNTEQGSTGIVELYDWSRQLQQQHKEEKPNRRKEKRSHDDLFERAALDHDDKNESPTHLLGKIPINLKDRHGTRSGLSCMALNDCGSALVCGSEDGDMFLWRGG